MLNIEVKYFGGNMPFVTIELIEGRTLDQKRKMAELVTKGVAEACDIPLDRVHVFIKDLKKDEYGCGGKLIIDN